MDLNQKVWAPDAEAGFVLGLVSDIGADSITVSPLRNASSSSSTRSGPSSKPITAPYDLVFPAEDDDSDDGAGAKTVEDNCALMYLNEATLLNNVRRRYAKDEIYTYVANILVALNPYKPLRHLYDAKTISSYRGRSLGTIPPHVFAIADKAYRDMRAFRQSQSLIVSGESGAGKTESTKHVIKYLTESFGGGTVENGGASSIEQRIVESNPLLEAFGNAKTVRNNNSSRFGKFVEIHFGTGGGGGGGDSAPRVVGGHVSHYLLEKSRICTQAPEERNYHIFYQLIAGGPEALRQELALTNPDDFHYLNEGCTRYFSSPASASKLKKEQLSEEMGSSGGLTDIQLDDVDDFAKTDAAMAKCNISSEVRRSIYSTVAAVLHLGNISFDAVEDSRGGCVVDQNARGELEMSARLLGVNSADLEDALTSRVMQTSKGGLGGTVIKVPLRCGEASAARDALAKHVYSKLFDAIVDAINDSIPCRSSSSYIGVLDIAGFEYFQSNSFEQFCINYCNEKLQQFFNERILKDEQDLYEKEGLNVKKIHFLDNEDCISLIEGKSSGIFDILDEVSRLPTPSYDKFTSTVQQKNKGHFRLDFPRKSKLKIHRELRDEEGFLIRHFAGAVCYETQKFIEKNNDALHQSLEFLVMESNNQFLKKLFDNSANNAPKGGKRVLEMRGSTKVKPSKLNFISVGSKFRSQLNVLMEKLSSTGTHFVRCVKPNLKMVDKLFEGVQILSQLQCSGMTSVLDLMQQGYPSRAPFQDLYDRYKLFLPRRLASLDPRLFCKALFKALGLDDNDFKFGLTKVFFRPGKFAEFDTIMRSDPDNLKQMVAKVTSWLIRSRWRKAQWGALSVIKLKNKIKWRAEQIVIIQKNFRMLVVRRRFSARIKGVSRLKLLVDQIQAMRQVANGLGGNEQKTLLAEASTLEANLQSAVGRLKSASADSMDASAINSLVDALWLRVDGQLASVKTTVENDKRRKKKEEEEEKKRKREAEEREKIRKVEIEMENQKRKRGQEEKKRRAEEEEKRQRIELETKRAEEAAAAASSNLLVASQVEIERRLLLEAKEEVLKMQKVEQERRDRELALRLARGEEEVEDMMIMGGLKRGSQMQEMRRGQSSIKNKMTSWSYAQLRDVINTSCDVEQLEACKEEFHRRLKAYKQWKWNNQRQDAVSSPSPPPSNPGTVATEAAVGAASASLPSASSSSVSNGDRKETLRHPLQRDDGDGRRLPSNEVVDENDISMLLGDDVSQNGEKQRFFKVPFNTSGPDFSGLNGRGWWFAHFSGRWVRRQMEVYHDRPAVLLVAGKDDMRMCELALEETGLVNRKGAEILESDYEREWRKHGGLLYIDNR